MLCRCVWRTERVTCLRRVNGATEYNHDQALAQAASGEIIDAKSIAGLFRAQRLLAAERGA